MIPLFLFLLFYSLVLADNIIQILL
jgi:hypothetical protein